MNPSITRAMAGALLLIGSLGACGGNDGDGATSPPINTAPTHSASMTSSAPPSTAIDTTSASPAPTTSPSSPGWTLPLVCDGACNPPVEVLFTVPVGDDGVTYANIDLEEAVGSGPGAFAIDVADRLWIIDEVDRQLLRFTPDGSPGATVDLTAYEVASAVDIAARSDGLLLLDINVATQR